MRIQQKTIDEINALYKEGLSVLKISKIVGHDRMAVKRNISGYAKKPRSGDTKKDEEAIKMFLEGISIKEIAEILGLAVKTVRNYLPREITSSYQRSSYKTAQISLEGVNPTVTNYLMQDGVDQSPGYTIKKLQLFDLNKREATNIYWNWRYKYVRGDLEGGMQ